MICSSKSIIVVKIKLQSLHLILTTYFTYMCCLKILLDLQTKSHFKQYSYDVSSGVSWVPIFMHIFSHIMMSTLIVASPKGGSRGVGQGAMPPPQIRQHYRGFWATYQRLTDRSSIRGPPQSKILEPPMSRAKHFTMGSALKYKESWFNILSWL